MRAFLLAIFFYSISVNAMERDLTGAVIPISEPDDIDDIPVELMLVTDERNVRHDVRYLMECKNSFGFYLQERVTPELEDNMDFTGHRVVRRVVRRARFSGAAFNKAISSLKRRGPSCKHFHFYVHDLGTDVGYGVEIGPRGSNFTVIGFQKDIESTARDYFFQRISLDVYKRSGAPGRRERLDRGGAIFTLLK